MTTHVPPVNHIQARWASVIRDRVLMSAISLKLLPEGETSTAKLPESCHQVMGPLCAKLLERACESTVQHPKADAAILRMIQREVWRALADLSGIKFGAHVQHDFSFMPVLLESVSATFELTPHGVRELTPRISNARGHT